MSYTRRQVVRFLGGVVAYTYGKPQYPNMRQTSMPNGINLVLDGMEAVTVHYRGRSVSITPEEIMSALSQNGK